MLSWLGMITAIVRVEQLTRNRSSPLSLGRTSATFHVEEGTVTWPLASVVVTPPRLPVPPTPVGPETIYSSSFCCSTSVRRYPSNDAQGPWLLPGACATMFDIRKVAWLMGTDVSLSRSAFGVMWPRSKPLPEKSNDCTRYQSGGTCGSGRNVSTRVSVPIHSSERCQLTQFGRPRSRL